MPFRIRGSTLFALGRLAAACLIVSAGCQPSEQVSKYTAPRDPIDIETISDDDDDGPKTRILGAIALAGKPGEDSWYFFKMQEKPKAIERHAAAFDEFIRSVKFPENTNPTWKLPGGWREISNRGKDRIATLRMKKSETPVDLSVTKFGGKLIDNINRWREQQAGAEPITEAEIETKCKVLTIDGRKVIIVDVSGPGGKGGMTAPFAK